MAGVDLSYVKAAGYDDPPEVDARYGFADGKALPGPTPFGVKAGLAGFYDVRDEVVGGTDTHYNMADGPDQAGGNWASYGDSVDSFVSGSGLDGERTGFSKTLGPSDLAEGNFPR